LSWALAALQHLRPEHSRRVVARHQAGPHHGGARSRRCRRAERQGGDAAGPAVALHVHGVDEARAGLEQCLLVISGAGHLPHPVGRHRQAALLGDDTAGDHIISRSVLASSCRLLMADGCVSVRFKEIQRDTDKS
jgi:hypothetical protein